MMKSKILKQIVSLLLTATILLTLGACGGEKSKLQEALNSGDISAVEQEYYKMISDGKEESASQIVTNFIFEINEKLSDFTMDANQITDETAFENAVYQYLSVDDDFISSLRNLGNPNINAGINRLLSTKSSKQNYYIGVYRLSTATKAEDYEDAVFAFERVSETDPLYKDAVTKSGEACTGYINAIMKTADEYIAKGDFSAAIELLNKATGSDLATDSDDFKNKIDEVKKASAQKYADNAKNLLIKGDAKGAVGNMEAAYSIYPSDEYKAKIEEYKLYLPFELYKPGNVLHGDSFIIGDTMLSNNNVQFKNTIYDYKGSFFYNLNGNYDSVSGTVFLASERKNQSSSIWFEAYGDGELIYTSPKVTAGFMPQNISFNVSGVKNLEIKFNNNDNREFGEAHYCYVSNLIAQKNPPKQ